jgi:hypothetical protein
MVPAFRRVKMEIGHALSERDKPEENMSTNVPGKHVKMEIGHA